MSLPSLTNFDIIKIAKKMGLKLNGVFMKDELPEKLKNGNYIINMANHQSVGTHWIGMIIMKPDAVYFDSFGAPYPLEVLHAFQDNDIEDVYWNKDELQDIDADSCGWWVLALLSHVQNAPKNWQLIKKLASFNDFFTDDTIENEEILEGLFD